MPWRAPGPATPLKRWCKDAGSLGREGEIAARHGPHSTYFDVRRMDNTTNSTELLALPLTHELVLLG